MNNNANNARPKVVTQVWQKVRVFTFATALSYAYILAQIPQYLLGSAATYFPNSFRDMNNS